MIIDIWLLFFRARFYDPALGRFASAASIVLGGVQGLDRYAYANNSPVRYVDPSGHVSCSSVAEGDCTFENKTWAEMYGISISNDFDQNERLAILKGVSAVGNAFARA
jgi:hypothetical protein